MRRVSSRSIAITLAVLALAAFGAPAAGATPGQITEYPIPVSTTPYAVTPGPDGRIWFVDSGNHVGGPSVGRMTTSGAISASDVVNLPSGALGIAITTGPDGNMWVQQDNAVDRMPVAVADTGSMTQFALGAGTGGYGSITPGPDGRLWFGFNQQVGAIDTAGTITPYPTTATSSISGVISGPGGFLWFGQANAIARITTAGTQTAGDVFPLPAGDGQINDLALGADGNVWFTLGAPASIGRITPAGVITLFPTPTAASLPFGIDAGPDGRLWFTERNSDRIGSIPTTATSGADITEYPVTGSNVGLIGITAGPDGRMWFVEFNNGALGAITTDVAAATVTRLLTVTRSGTGTGTVTSTPAGISCGTACSASYADGASVTLVAAAAPGSTFAGWTGDCAGTGACTVTMAQARTVGATFTASGTAPLPDLPAVPTPAACVPGHFSLTDVFPSGSRTHVIGVAGAAAAGKRVRIVSTWNGRTVARTVVRKDGSFTTTAALPPRSLRASSRARYQAILGAKRSAALKFARRMYTTAITAKGRTITFSGVVTPPLAAPPQLVTIRASSDCSSIAGGAVVATVKPTAKGAFRATITLPAGLRTAAVVYFRASTRIRKTRRSSTTSPTYTLIRGVVVGG